MSLDIRKGVDSKDHLSDLYKAESDYYNLIGEWRLAYKSLARYQEINDKATDGEIIAAVSDIHTRYATERKQRQILLLAAQQELADIKLNWLLVALVGTAGLIILLLVLARILHNRYQYKKRSEEKIKTLMRELHHRVKNNLQVLSDLLSLQSSRLEDITAREAVKSGEDRVNAMALIHQDIYFSDELKDIDMPNYINKLVRNLMTSFGYTERQIKLDVSTDQLQLDVDKAIPLGLIINELVSNALKYAFKDIEEPILKVSLNKQSNQDLILQVSDNGVGVPDGEVINSGSFGLKLVNMLTRQLHGSIKTITSPGMSYYLQFSLGK